MVSLFGSLFANNLDLNGTRVYAVVIRSFAASPFISSWSYISDSVQATVEQGHTSVDSGSTGDMVSDSGKYSSGQN